MTELLTTKEIAQYLKLRSETVLRKVKTGEIPAIKVGGRFRFDKEEIDQWLRHNATSTKSMLVSGDEHYSTHLFKQPQDTGYRVVTAHPAV